METDPIELAGSKRGSSQGDDREKKRFRESRPEDSPETLARAASEVSNGDGARSKNSNMSSPDLRPGASQKNAAKQPEDMVWIRFPPSAKEHQADFASTAAASNEGGPAVSFNQLDNGDGSRQLHERRQFEKIPLSVDVLLAQTTSSSVLPTQPCQNWLFLILLIAGCCCATAFFQSSPDVRTFQHVIPPKHALDAARTGRNINQDLLESHLSNLTLRDFLTDPRGFHLGMAVRVV